MIERLTLASLLIKTTRVSSVFGGSERTRAPPIVAVFTCLKTTFCRSSVAAFGTSKPVRNAPSNNLLNEPPPVMTSPAFRAQSWP